MSNHTILIKQTMVTVRKVDIQTGEKYPDLKSLRELVALGVNNIGFDDIGSEVSVDCEQTVDGIEIDYINED